MNTSVVYSATPSLGTDTISPMPRRSTHPPTIAYQMERTWLGTWRRYTHPDGGLFAEYRSRHSLLGLPLIHYARGISPETGSREVARGVLAVGRVAVGVVAVGQVALGLIGIGQFSLGLLLGIGQLTLGPVALGQVALGGVAVGQLVMGYLAVGQYALGHYVLAQGGTGVHILSQHHVDPEAQRFFAGLYAWLRGG